MRKIDRQIVSALLISEENKLLIGMKNPDKGGVYANCWHIPGGGVEKGEDKLSALRREISEEVGIDFPLSKAILVDDKGKGVSIKRLKDGEEVECYMSFYVYRIELAKSSKDIKVSLSDDLEKYIWVDLDKLGEYKLAPPSSELFTRLGWLK